MNDLLPNKFTGASPSWMLQDATFEKMGVMMHDNNGRLLGLFDELSAFLTKIRLYNTRGITDSHELAMFLELYNANPWTRITGYHFVYLLYVASYIHVFVLELNNKVWN